MDYVLENHGSLWLMRPTTEEFAKWLKETAPEDAQFLGSAMAIEPRYVEGVVEAATAAGFSR